MGKIVVSQFVSLDGVVEDPAGIEGLGRGAWCFEFDRGPEGDRYKVDEVMAGDALLLGRTTYRVYADSWPTRDGAFADKFNAMPKYLVSTTMAEGDWNNTMVIGDDVAARVAQLKDEHDGDILVTAARNSCARSWSTTSSTSGG